MRHWRSAVALLSVFLVIPAAATPPTWRSVEPAALVGIDDDISRNINREGFLSGINISETRFSENGFDWHLVRFTSVDKPDGPNWVVPHDDENAAFDAMIASIHTYGGMGVAVNSGQGSARRQPGLGICGVKFATVTGCDPNRNFDAQSPLFTAMILDLFKANQPIIALHTNSFGFTGDGIGGNGDITIYDRQAFAVGEKKARKYGHLASAPTLEMANPDSFALSPFLATQGSPSRNVSSCGISIAQSGIHFWYEPVRVSDGSLSNYLILNRPDLTYLNAESRTENDLALAARRHVIMIAAYINKCAALWEQPSALP